MGSIDGVIEPIYFLITSIGFIILSVIQYKKFGKSIETIYLSILSIFFLVCFIILNYYWTNDIKRHKISAKSLELLEENTER